MKYRVSLYFCILVLVIFTTLFSGARTPVSAAPVIQAQQNIVLDSVRVDVWPEYDQPSVLVIYNVTLASTVNLPAAMSMRIPAATGKPYAVAMQDVNGLYDLKYDLQAAGDWIQVNFTTPVPEIRVEYYDPTLAKTGAQRDFTFRWPGDYAVNNLVVKVQQPVGANGMSFRPDIGSGVAGSDGLTYFTQVVGKISAGTTFELQMTYSNPGSTLTNPEQFQPAQPVQPVDSNTSGRVTILQGFSMSTLQLVLLGVGLLLIAGGLVWYWQTGARTRRATASEGARKRHARSSSAQVDEPASSRESAFCHQCGKKAAAGDVFCRACGTRLR